MLIILKRLTEIIQDAFYNYKAVINDIQTLDKNANVLDIGGGLGDFFNIFKKLLSKIQFRII